MYTNSEMLKSKKNERINNNEISKDWKKESDWSIEMDINKCFLGSFFI